MPAEAAVSFCLTADASHYGLPVVGYRVGWDVADPDDDEAWGMAFAPYPGEMVCSSPHTFMAGSHIFYAEVICYDGYKSRVPILAHIVAPTSAEPTTWGRIKALYSD